MPDQRTAPPVPEFSRRQLDVLPDAVFATSSDGDVVYWGEAAERTLGWPRELAEGSSCALLLDGVDRLGELVCAPSCPLARAAGLAGAVRCPGQLGRVGWQAPAPAVAVQPHPDMLVARADGGRIAAVLVAFPARLDGVPVLLHLLRQAETPDRDALTGGLTRDVFALRVVEEQHRADRTGRSLALALVDVDQLKRINDTEGHDAGDRALAAIADVLRGGRREDLLGRWGGDEFVLLFPDTGADGAVRHLDHSLAALGDHSQRRRIAFSAGVVEMGRGEGLEAAIRRADVLLYRAKRRGRGRILS